MALSKQALELIAGVIRREREVHWRVDRMYYDCLASSFALALQATNENFDSKKFLEAAGVESSYYERWRDERREKVQP
jgi:hypothetical protein